MARCFSIGKQESQAVSNIMTKMSAQAVTFLTNSVRSRGMMKYLQHDVIGRDICNVNFSSGIQGFEQWKEEFRNHENDELVIRLHIWNALKAQYHFFDLMSVLY